MPPGERKYGSPGKAYGNEVAILDGGPEPVAAKAYALTGESLDPTYFRMDGEDELFALIDCRRHHARLASIDASELLVALGLLEEALERVGRCAVLVVQVENSLVVLDRAVDLRQGIGQRRSVSNRQGSRFQRAQGTRALQGVHLAPGRHRRAGEMPGNHSAAQHKCQLS